MVYWSGLVVTNILSDSTRVTQLGCPEVHNTIVADGCYNILIQLNIVTYMVMSELVNQVPTYPDNWCQLTHEGVFKRMHQHLEFDSLLDILI